MNRGLRRLKEYVKHCHECYVSSHKDPPYLRNHESEAYERKMDQYHKRGAEIVKNIVDGQVISQQNYGDHEMIDYVLVFQHLVRHGKRFYFEEQVQYRRAVIIDDDLADDYLLMEEGDGMEEKGDRENQSFGVETEEPASYRGYNRLEVVKYAERYWNTSNPAYKKFENNCTNYLSQCLKAGGIPMTGAGNRSKGWWYSGKSWSYSWTVANAFRWYMSGVKSTIRAREVSSPEDLIRGDVICYDFTGDGHWQHTTIVVAKDDKNMPLVNANTTNSRMRYWAYEDSTAWTPNIKYKFFHVKD
ncbi:amidase domain-containing protein [Bacillus sp. H-16]|uniref:amidase domain-containing protein n=1 Tax=Alteribacter salitolerans TaxID=2912333 RepID=UPI0019643796|nr:amidase domain-containing protein [Alteribacter salitolerans]MBM7097924.1 amidase domain-containing protein [Alteribacter salitolerans]